MKFNVKFLFFAAIILALALIVPTVFAQGTEPPASSAPTVPNEIQLLLAAGVGFLVTNGLKSLSQLLGKDISGWAAAITASVVTGIVAFANSLLSAVPAANQETVVILFTLLVSILGAFGAHYSLKAKA